MYIEAIYSSLSLSSLDSYHIMIAATTISLAFLLVYFFGAEGFSSFLGKQNLPQVVSTTSLQRRWEDLAPPFNVDRSTSEFQDAWEHEQEDVVHFCFLVHGHRGLSKVCFL